MGGDAVRHLIVGAARSGKSRRAEQLALASGKRPFYLATAQPGDEEMAARIAHHRQRRGPQWTLVEEPVALGAALAALDAPGHCLLVDCLTLWLSNCLHADCWGCERAALLDALERCRADVVLVGNEVGGGIVPLGELSRRFVDENGRLHQLLGERCERVTAVIAGLPLSLKEPAP